MSDIARKLTSRKLWAMIIGVASGLAMVFGLDEHIIMDVSGAVVALASLVTYIVAEGKIDAAAAKAALEAAQGALVLIPEEEDEHENKPIGY